MSSPRNVELKQRALSQANELTFLARQTEATLKGIEARLGPVPNLDHFRKDKQLAYQRANAYSGDLCPRCAVRDDSKTALAVEATSGDLEFVRCPACGFHAVLPK
jgi:Zn ribbon nucleic-acid-binding protein